MDALKIIMVIVELIQKYGVPAALRIINEWQVDDPTIEDFEALRDKVRDPEEFFNG